MNIGAGTITANYDGTRKHPTTIGDGAFIGVDTMLIAPIEIGERAKTGAGAIVTHGVPAGALAYGVPARVHQPRCEIRRAGAVGLVDIIVPLVVIAVLTFFEAIFVAAEIALVTMRRTRIDQLVEEGAPSARRVKHLVSQPGRFLAVTQIGLTFIGFLASAYAAVNLTTHLQTALEGTGLGFLASSAEALALIIVTLLLSLFTIVFGELVPKSLALAHAEAFALRLSWFITLMLRILGPLVRALTAVTNSVARLLGAGEPNPGVMSTEELKILVERGGEQGILEAEEEQMIHAVIELGDQRIHEVMVPRIAMISLAVDATMEEAIDIVIEQGHSRIPVYEDTIDEIVGHPLCQGPPAVPEAERRRAARVSGRSCARRSSCPSR